ncbi:MAG: hypothetical protein RL037_2097 [Bacteroidota bacterium]|jgi:hypothetical protein
MQNSTQNIILIGNHVDLHAKVFLENQHGYTIFQLKYKAADPFDEHSTNVLFVNSTPFPVMSEYTLGDLILEFKANDIISSLFNSSLIVGDPSELLYQAFLFAKLNEDPTNFRGPIDFPETQDAANLFLYPIGMYAQDIRKELSNLVYCLKKHEMPTYLIRKEEKDLESLFKLILNCLSFMTLAELEDQIKGIEHLVSPRLSIYE